MFNNFGLSPKLKVNGKNTLLNNFGIFLGISYLLGLIIFITFSLNKILEKENFILLNSIKSNNFTEIKIQENFKIFFFLTDSQGNEIPEPEKIFEIKGNFFNKTITKNEITKKITKIPLKNLPENSENINFFQMANFLPNEISLKGNEFPRNNFTSLNFQLNKCQKNCMSESDAENILSDLKLYILFNNTEINFENKENPLKDFQQGHTFDLSNFFRKKIIMEVNEIEFNSDNGILSEKINTYKGFKIQEAKENSKFLKNSNEENETFCQIIFQNSGKKEIYKRNYSKIYSILPYILCYYIIIKSFFKFLVNFFCIGNLEEFIISKILNEKEFKKLEDKENVNYKDIFNKTNKIYENNNNNEIENISKINIQNNQPIPPPKKSNSIEFLRIETFGKPKKMKSSIKPMSKFLNENSNSIIDKSDNKNLNNFNDNNNIENNNDINIDPNKNDVSFFQKNKQNFLDKEVDNQKRFREMSKKWKKISHSSNSIFYRKNGFRKNHNNIINKINEKNKKENSFMNINEYVNLKISENKKEKEKVKSGKHTSFYIKKNSKDDQNINKPKSSIFFCYKKSIMRNNIINNYNNLVNIEFILKNLIIFENLNEKRISENL